jgi:hypothetical protein
VKQFHRDRLFLPFLLLCFLPHQLPFRPVLLFLLICGIGNALLQLPVEIRLSLLADNLPVFKCKTKQDQK